MIIIIVWLYKNKSNDERDYDKSNNFIMIKTYQSYKIKDYNHINILMKIII